MKKKSRLKEKILSIILVLIVMIGTLLEPVEICAAQKINDEFLQYYKDKTNQELQIATPDQPFQLIYGTENTIYVDNEEETLFYETFSIENPEIIKMIKEENPERQGCVAFRITPLHVGETVINFHQSEQKNLKVCVKVNPKEVDIDGTNSFMTYSKIYDNDRQVFEDINTSDDITLIEIPLKEVLDEDQEKVKIDLENVRRLRGNLPDDFPLNVTVKTDTAITFQQSQFSLTGEAAENYILRLNTEITIPAKVTINKRPVAITVSDAIRSFGHAYHNEMEGNDSDYEFIPEDWLDVELGSEDGTSGILEKAYTDPESADALIEEQTGGNEANQGEYPHMLSVDTSKIPNCENYDFNITKGTLVIKQEEISNKNLASYLVLENSVDNPTMYFDESGKLWVKADGGVLKLSTRTTKMYDCVQLIKVGEKQVNANLTVDGYTFREPEKTGELTLTLQLTNGKGAKSQEFKYVIYLDHTAPQVFISSVKEGKKTPLENLVDKISFGAFDKTAYTVEIKVSEEEASGLKEWTYMVLPLNKDMRNDSKKDNSEFLKYVEALQASGKYTWQPMCTSQDPIEIQIARRNHVDPQFIANNYVVLVKPYDHVTNSNIYTSLGIILDNNDPYIDLTLADDQDEKEIYNSDVNLHVTIADNNKSEDKTISGLKEVFYQIAVGRDHLDKAEKQYLYQAEKDRTYTLEELQKEVLSKDIIVEKKWNSNDIWVRVTAIDQAGNIFFTHKQLKIDTVPPQVRVMYETKATEEYAPYYKEDRTAVINIQERNIDITKLEEMWFELQCEGEENSTAYTWSELKEVKGITCEFLMDSEEGKKVFEHTDERTVNLRICFHGDNRYYFQVHCKDAAGWENQEKTGSSFVIDKTAPVIKVSYWNEDDKTDILKQSYSNKPVTTRIEIQEHNFAVEGKEIPVEVSVEVEKIGINETISDYNKQEKENSSEIWTSNGDLHTSTYKFTSDGNYKHGIAYTDLAGNKSVYGIDSFTVDKTQPTALIKSKGIGFWEQLLEKITFGLFHASSIEVEITGADYTSPIQPVQYARFHDQMSKADLESYEKWSDASAEKPETATVTVNRDERFIVYAKVTDYAGNYQFFSSDGMIVDCIEPAPLIKITNLSSAENGLFHEDVKLQIEVEDPIVNESYAGLERVWYEISAEGNINKNETIELLNNSKQRVQGNRTFSKIITVPAEIYNSNSVKVQVFATDFAGNKGESNITELKMDVTEPEISVAWNLNSSLNGKYYKDTRIATVTVKERNFVPDCVNFKIENTDGKAVVISEWSSDNEIGVSDNATSTCQVSFPEDGDYTFTLECKDLAGNITKYGQTDVFTIDKTAPVIEVFYDNNNVKNGSYFKEARTATINIYEHNFHAEDVRSIITATMEGKEIFVPSVGDFSGNGDVHTATISYTEDGDYTFDIEYADMAGNVAADYEKDSFTVDRTAPKLEIVEVEDKSANNDIVSPRVNATDINYDLQGTSVTIKGMNHGYIEVEKTISEILNGQSLKFNDFARNEEMDDLYKLHAKAVDMAGNETEKEIVFSVNRYGSIFLLDDRTKEWLKTGKEGYTYLKEEKAIGIREINVDPITDRSIVINRDGNLKKLEENKNFTVKETGSDVQWKEVHYVIAKENFKDEGNYTVILTTQDKAKNSMNNTSVKKENRNLPVEFSVDKTAPTIVVSGLKNKEKCRAAEKFMMIDAKDNLALTRVSVKLNNKKTVYEGKKLMENQGIIEMSILGANKWQNIEIVAEDATGNRKSTSFQVLITPNIFIQYYMNKPFFYSSIIIFLVMAGGMTMFIWKKEKGRNS